MYVPEPFRLTDRNELHGIIRANNFGVLVTVSDGVPAASHLPFLIDPSAGELGTLRAHMARTNPQWRGFDGAEALVIFSGPHGYVSPSWYATCPAVPTWNYVAVHAYGVPAAAEGDSALAHLAELVQRHEARFASPWSLDGQDPGYVAGMSRGVVAFEIPISRLEGKAKLSQNRPAADRAGVVAALEASGGDAGASLAQAMRRHLP